ncbi:uncharacterized protein A4U43_C07F22670 [Asparagus officinalis]|uniref:Uncharacterized protein n=1 Tax=Asparagus officinalis TaxID=4686 RepID=A0A5P1EE25_ASPOF|nr:uncharacterized protein A4U43_C07F22670 [Asparagus officinalis]
MALAHLVLSLSPSRPGLGNDVVERRKGLALALYGEVLTGREVTGRIFEVGSRLDRREVKAWARLKAVEVARRRRRRPPAASRERSEAGILGVPEKAEKDEVVKAAMVLKNSEIEDGYTPDAIVSRQELLVDVRDKILFEPEYAGNLKDKIPPRSSLRIPWSWLPGALCLLQEVNKAKTICECLTASEGVDLKFEEAFCSLLLGQGSETVAAEMLRQLEVNGSSAVRKFESNIPNKEANDKGTGNQLLMTC